MKKVIIVNLNGRDYKLEEEGYKALREYLDRAERRLKENPDRSEILSDFEQAIADKCEVYLSDHKTVVSTGEVENIIREMGPVDAGEEKSSENETTDDTPQPKRLYQIKEGAWISGVCNGLAAYFNIDVTIVRVIFIVLTILTHGAFILVYIILMFIIPWANTPEQRAQARGETFSADDFFKKSSIKYKELRAKHILPEAISQEQFVENWRFFHHTGNKILALCIGLFTGIIIWLWIASLFSVFTSGKVFSYTIGVDVSVWVLALYVTSIFFLLFWPLKIWIRSTLVSAGVYKKDLKRSEKAINVAGWIGWIVAIVLFVGLSIVYSTGIAHNISHFQQVLTHGERSANWQPIHYHFHK